MHCLRCGLLQEAVSLQPVDGNVLGGFATNLDAAVELLQSRQVELLEQDVAELLG